MALTIGADFTYEEDGIFFRVFHKNKRVKVTAKLGNKMVVEYADTPYLAAEMAKKILLKPTS